MDNSSPHLRIRGLVAPLAIVLGMAAMASAQLDVELAGVSGVYQYATLCGDVYVPATPGEQDARLLVRGVQALGYQQWDWPPLGQVRTASEFHFSLSSIAWPDTIEWLGGVVYLPEETGYFDTAIELHESSDPSGPIVWIEGGNYFRLQVGRPSMSYQDFWYDLVLPSVQIYSVHLVSGPAVPAEQTNWGAVKCLFR